MREMHLVANELMKIYKRKTLWVMVAILAVVVIIMAAAILKNTPNHDNWKSDLQKQNVEMTQSLNDKQVPKEAKEAVLPQVKENQYRLDHNIPPLFSDTVFGFMKTTGDLVSVLIGVFVVIIGGSIVSQEYSWGTIKLLMIRPTKRWKILLSKFIAVIVTGIFFIALGFLLQLIVGALFFGFDMGPGKYLYLKDNTVHIVSMGTHFLQYYASSLVDVIIMATFAFMLSTIFKTNALAIGLSIFLSLAGPIVVSLLSFVNENIAKYLFFLNTDLYQFVEGPTLLKDTTLAFSACVLAVYFAIFLIVSFLIFNKRDIAE
ncbi:ABC transporter permease [Tuberibacillus calidus]|uniref:ABC transporter permease n=1 Tax=Tuberibacillus calidus TaxID=340097 RepID=UPI0004279BC4|nr:ABC transporter permease [Tuberibacillus calidus]